MKKSLVAILTATVIAISFLGPALLPVQAADPSNWYMTVPGVLDTDTYWLYPFEINSSLKIGFSKFGELINSNDNTGLEYGEVDPFAPPAGSGTTAQVPKRMWLQGWLINITYTHRTQGPRNVWATAMHGDSIDYGHDWLRVDFNNDYSTQYGYEDPRDRGYLIGDAGYPGSLLNGGRKTNGTAVTMPFEVLYNGPREFIAMCNTTIYDHPLYLDDSTGSDIALVEVRITLIFNKVKKEVILLKDIKSLLAWKEGEKMKIEFSNRGEVDLGKESTGFGSFAHFYTQGTWSYPSFPQNDTWVEGQSTCYGAEWEINQTETPGDPEYPGFTAAGPYPQTSAPHSYDVAQAINAPAGYVWFAAFWPSLSDWSIDGWDNWWHSLHTGDPHYIDYHNPTDEPFIPFYIGEWDFILYHTQDAQGRVQFRAVTVYGVTKLHDAADDDADDVHGEQAENIIDREVKYQLDEVFNPWDLESAVHKETDRWVEWKTTTATTYTTARRPVVVTTDSQWDQYCVFSERVIRQDTNTLLNRYKNQYDLTLNSDGTATFTGLPTATCKILYSTRPDVTGQTCTGCSTDSGTAYNVTQWNITATTPNSVWVDNIGVTHGFSLAFPAMTVYPTSRYTSGANTNWTETWTLQKEWNETDFKVFLNETYISSLPNFYDPINVTQSNGNFTFLFDMGALSKNLTATSDSSVIYPLPKETVHVVYLNHTISVTFTITQRNYTDAGGATLNSTWTVDKWIALTADYNNKLMGRYEFGIVGRDASSVDSAGLSLVSAALKNKQVNYVLAGADMYDADASSQMPWVMAKIGAGDTRANYYYSGTDFRTALKDDWCHTFPIASSNMIAVGGPRANVLSWYGNDFPAVLFGLDEFTDYTNWNTKIAAVTCWNKKAYASTGLTGYATVNTYKDINGTVLLMIWGYNGIDTYYVTRWFHEEGVYQLQEAPLCLTSIIVKITYESTTEGNKPTAYEIVECLGTISERQWVHGAETKGGIHDP
ncbi:MAG TPA: hypothetical protein VIH48_01015 [Candidatus Bathyarchaeia archaeon]